MFMRRSVVIFAFTAIALAALYGCASATKSSVSQQPPPLNITISSLPVGQVGTPYNAMLTATGGTAPYSWAISNGALPSGLSLNAATGSITGTPTTAIANTAVVFRITDSGNPAQTQTTSLTLTVNTTVVPVSITTTSLPAGTVNVAYSQQLAATGGSGSYTWTLTTPVTGFTLSTSGLLSGTVTSAGTLTFQLKATDASNASNSATATLSLTVNATVLSVSITTTSLPAGTVNLAYSQQLAATGGSGSYTWTLTPVTGFTLSTSGLLSGTATSAGTLTFQVKATDASNASNSATATLSLTVNTTSSVSFYVATTGSDSNSGTISSPWRTIQHAANSVQAGDTVFVRAGTYNESVNIPISGSASAGPVIFQSYPGENAIIDGTGLTPSGSQGLINISSQSYVTIEGFEIRNYQTSSASVVPAGIWVSGAGSHIQILNNRIHNIVTTAETTGNAFGVAIYGTDSTTPLDTVTFTGNEVYALRTGNSESVTFNGNVTNFSILNNMVHDNDNIGIDAIGFEGTSSNPATDYARNGLISGNTVYNISAINNPGEGNQYDADGIYVDGGSQIIIERNLVYSNDLNIEVASEHSGHVASYVTVRNNLVYFGNSVGISIGGYASNVGGTDHCTIVNNTLYENDAKNTGSGEFQVQYYATNNVFENNIVYANSQGLLINGYTNSEANPVVVDYNVFFSSLSSSSASFVWNGTNYTGFSTYQSATSNDSHSKYADPQFLSLITPNLQIAPTSPAINTGSNLGVSIVGTLDFAGNPRTKAGMIDIGAYEQ